MKYLPIALIMTVLGGAVAVSAAPAEPRAKATQKARAKQASKPATMLDDVEVKGYVLPIAAAVQSAQLSVSALSELAGTESVHRRDVGKLVELAMHAVRIATTQATNLIATRRLPAQEHADAQGVQEQLRSARGGLSRIDRSVAKPPHELRRDLARQIGKDSLQVHGDLSRAEQKLEGLASRHHVPLRFEMPRATSSLEGEP